MRAMLVALVAGSVVLLPALVDLYSLFPRAPEPTAAGTTETVRSGAT